MQGLLKLNLGCGARIHPDWVNIDFSQRAVLQRIGVLQRWFGRPPASYLNHDLRNGIPFADGSACMIYSSHLIEHLARMQAKSLLKEIHRVLCPEGVVRLVVPDLEHLARTYIQALDAVRRNEAEGELQHEWAILLLLDQMVRTRCGGELVTWLRRHRDSQLVMSMTGILAEIVNQEQPSTSCSASLILRHWLRLDDPRATGELHRFMYDDISLAALLRQTGFRETTRMTAISSTIPGWTDYNLDTDIDGRPGQPGSLWMEAIK
jgi:predicted SAM-dependent methyltransferase